MEDIYTNILDGSVKYDNMENHIISQVESGIETYDTSYINLISTQIKNQNIDQSIHESLKYNDRTYFSNISTKLIPFRKIHYCYFIIKFYFFQHNGYFSSIRCRRIK